MRIFKKPIINFLYLVLFFLIFFLKFYFLDKFFIKILIKFKDKKKHIIKKILRRNENNPKFAIYNEILERIEIFGADYKDSRIDFEQNNYFKESLGIA